MTAREFFYLTASVRSAQNEYFRTRDQRLLAKCRALEKELDNEIKRVKELEEAAAMSTPATNYSGY